MSTIWIILATAFTTFILTLILAIYGGKWLLFRWFESILKSFFKFFE